MADFPLYKYRVWCDTEGAHVFTDYRVAATGAPALCPNDSGHTIDAQKTTIVDQVVDTTVEIAGPKEEDGRNVFVIAPMSKGMYTFFTGAGDDPNPPSGQTGNGTGTPIDIQFTEPDIKTIDILLNNCTELHDGQVFYSPIENWNIDDRFSFFVHMPATEIVANAGLGNVHAVDVGGYNTLIPAAGNGSHDADLAAAVPIDASGKGYWDVDKDTGEITPSSNPGAAGYYLLTIPIEIYFMRNMPCGHPLGVLDIDTYKSEWIHKNWILRFMAKRVTAGDGRIGGWVLTYRRNPQ